MAKRKKRAADLSHISPALRASAVTVRGLHEDPDNVRRHAERNLEAIRASLERFGQQAPIVYVRRNRRRVVIKGNGLLAAARALGWTHVAAIGSELQAREATAYAIADNRTTDLSDFDEALLAAQLDELRAAEVPIEAMGFSDEELDDLLDAAEAGPGDAAGPAGGERRRGERTAVIVIGPVKFELPRRDFDAWLAGVEEKVGSDPDRLVKEFKRRLKL